MKLRVSAALSLPVEWMMKATVAYGARGTGKTTFASVAAEEVHRVGQRFCAIDLKGDFWGLKSTRSGGAAGIPVVVFGGDHADLPLEPDAGKFLGELGLRVTGSFENYLGSLHTMGVVEYPARGAVRAADLLFLREAA